MLKNTFLTQQEFEIKQMKLREEAQAMLDHADALEAEGRAIAAKKHAEELREYVRRRDAAANDNSN